ncbi:MAG: hypothetical protein AAF320_06230 [Myxococcota bacterium]
MLGCYLDPKNYYALQCIFDGEKREHLLRHFLNSMLHLEGEHVIAHIHLNGCHHTPTLQDSAERILVMRYRDQAGRECVKEVHGYRYLQDFILSLLPLSSFDKRRDHLKTAADKWSYFFQYASETYIRDIPAVLREPYLEEAFSILEQVGRSERHMAFYEKAEMDRMDLHSQIKTQYEEGFKKGYKEGTQARKALNIARAMRALGVSDKVITQATGLTVQELKDLG